MVLSIVCMGCLRCIVYGSLDCVNGFLNLLYGLCIVVWFLKFMYGYLYCVYKLSPVVCIGFSHVLVWFSLCVVWVASVVVCMVSLLVERNSPFLCMVFSML